MATELALSQLGREHDSRPNPLLGLVYASTPFASHFSDIQELLERRLPQVQWSGACVPGLCAETAEYVGEPAIAILIGQLPAGSVQAFGAAWQDARGEAERLATPGSSLLLHADPYAEDMSKRLRSLSEAAPPVWCSAVSWSRSVPSPAPASRLPARVPCRAYGSGPR
jgi:hypothetical protein